MTFASQTHTANNGVVWFPLHWRNDSDSEQCEWLMGGFSTRVGGVSTAYCAEGHPAELNLGFTATDARENVEQNRRLFVEAVSGQQTTPLITMQQIHSDQIVAITREDRKLVEPHKGDGLITAEPGVLIGIQTADCIPVLIVDRKGRVVAAIHAGWRGTVRRIAEAGVKKMRQEYGSMPEDLIAVIGTGIGRCCYSVGEELHSEFAAQFPYAGELFETRGDALYLDLVEANRRQLLDAGLDAQAIRTMGGCTHCQRDLFFSHRGEQGHTGRLLSVIGIRPE